MSCIEIRGASSFYAEYRDPDTGVHYYGNNRTLCPRYNADGSLFVTARYQISRSRFSIGKRIITDIPEIVYWIDWIHCHLWSMILFLKWIFQLRYFYQKKEYLAICNEASMSKDEFWKNVPPTCYNNSEGGSGNFKRDKNWNYILMEKCKKCKYLKGE